jgi:ATP-dependent DNA helicase RecQ
MERHGALCLTENSRPLLRGEIQLQLRRHVKALRKSRKSSTSKAAKKPGALRSDDHPLFEALRQCRLELSKDLGVPPYVIFHDSTLVEIARLRPATLDDMHLISGIGEQKLEKFGQAFLEIVEEHPRSI